MAQQKRPQRRLVIVLPSYVRLPAPVSQPPQRRRQRKRRKGGSSSGGAILMVIVLVVVGVWFAGGNKGGDKSSAPKEGTIEGSPRQLASQVLALGDDIVLTASSRTALDGYAKGGSLANFCGDAPQEVDPLLLQTLLKLQQDGYRVLVNNFGFGGDRERSLCYDKNGNRTHDQHMLFRAVDLNGIIKKGGPQTNWGHIEFRPGAEMDAIQGYADAWLDLLPRNRGGVGQEGCLNNIARPGGFHVHIPPGSTNIAPASFTDTCGHLHIDVRVR